MRMMAGMEPTDGATNETANGAVSSTTSAAARGAARRAAGQSAPHCPDWQPPLLPAPPAPKGDAGRSERLKQSGLLGIAQARSALAEAVRRAELRSQAEAA